ncbi:hypothetical protein [Paeniglutamicibacter sp. NPDC091659]|uniref:hypothetical protein n=1 Tax=Paeniglutamicibacter sp. NPDC091659 TaxID=3364389 RepID=UPI00381601E5
MTQLITEKELQNQVIAIIASTRRSPSSSLGYLSEDEAVSKTIDLIRSQMDALEGLTKGDAIALLCPATNCFAVTISSRELSRYQGMGEIADPPQATSRWIPCEKHYLEGATPFYCDKDGVEVSGDPETWPATEQREIN